MLYNKITENEKELIINHIKQYADLNPNHPMADLKDILRVWNTEKDYIYHLFGDQLIHEIPVHIDMPEDMLRREIQNFKDGNSFIYEIEDKYDAYIRNCYANSYDWYKGSYPGVVFNTECLMKNKLLHDFNIEINGQMKKIQKGTKPMKVIKMLCEFLNIDMEKYEKFRITHSQILNTKTLNGTLCLSIHPLDFMTMSDNEENWESCMSWRYNGGYRRGTVECMNSPCLFVAYLKSDVNTFDGWNSKKWRSLFAITPDMTTSIKGYPYQNKDLVKIVLNKIHELSNGKYDNEILDYDGEEILLSDDICKKYNTPRAWINVYHEYKLVMYNDFGSCDHYCLISPRLIDKARSGDTIYIEIGGDTTCMQCGEIDASYWHEGKLICMDCADMVVCAMCGTKVERSCASVTPSGEMICECCYCDHYTTTQLPVNKVVPIEEVTRIKILADGYELNEVSHVTYIPTIEVENDIWNNDPDLWNEYFTADKPFDVEGHWGNINHCVHWSQCKEKVFTELYQMTKENIEYYFNDLKTRLQK